MKNNNHAANCISCGNKLKYLQSSQELTCLYCGKKEKSNIVCSHDESHYICDDCHNIYSLNCIKEFVASTAAENPFETGYKNKNIYISSNITKIKTADEAMQKSDKLPAAPC